MYTDSLSVDGSNSFTLSLNLVNKMSAGPVYFANLYDLLLSYSLIFF